MSELPLAKKSLGQHWLTDPATLQAMCVAGQLAGDDIVLEIGPGTGSLTQVLLEHAGRVIAVEKDEDLARRLKMVLPTPQLQVIMGDIMTFDLTSLPAGYKVVANIPYYLTSHLIKILSTTVNPPSLAVLLVQKEVAGRICAEAGSMSLLSVSVQYYWQPRLGRIVPAALFMPPPTVDSQMLLLKRRGRSLFPDIDEKLFFRLVKAGFSERRKKLKSSLSGGLRLGKQAVTVILNETHINPDLRAQELSLDQWYDLYRCYSTHIAKSPALSL